VALQAGALGEADGEPACAGVGGERVEHRRLADAEPAGDDDARAGSLDSVVQQTSESREFRVPAE
jgi:hypothetical protein